MKSLATIEADFTAAIEMHEPQRTLRLVSLMNDLEQYHSAFIYNPSQEELERPAVQLYRKISLAREI